MRRGHLALCVGLGLFVGSAGCASSPPPLPEPAPVPPAARPVLPLVVTLIGRSKLNPDDGGQSLPTVVRIYQLKSTARLEAADYAQIYRDARGALAEDLVEEQELVLSPGETVNRSLTREKNARWIAIVAVVRHPSTASWRAIAELGPPDDPRDLTFTLEGYRVERQ